MPSVVGHTGNPGQIPYTMIKAGLDAFSKSLAQELAGRDILVNAVGGSTIIEDDVILAGQAGLADHLRVGRGARVAAQAGVIGDVPAGATVSGYPARSHRSVLRQSAALSRLAPLVASLERLVERDGS